MIVLIYWALWLNYRYTNKTYILSLEKRVFGSYTNNISERVETNAVKLCCTSPAVIIVAISNKVRFIWNQMLTLHPSLYVNIYSNTEMEHWLPAKRSIWYWRIYLWTVKIPIILRTTTNDIPPIHNYSFNDIKRYPIYTFTEHSQIYRMFSSIGRPGKTK